MVEETLYCTESTADRIDNWIYNVAHHKPSGIRRLKVCWKPPEILFFQSLQLGWRTCTSSELIKLFLGDQPHSNRFPTTRECSTFASLVNGITVEKHEFSIVHGEANRLDKNFGTFYRSESSRGWGEQKMRSDRSLCGTERSTLGRHCWISIFLCTVISGLFKFCGGFYY